MTKQLSRRGFIKGGLAGTVAVSVLKDRVCRNRQNHLMTFPCLITGTTASRGGPTRHAIP